MIVLARFRVDVARGVMDYGQHLYVVFVIIFVILAVLIRKLNYVVGKSIREMRKFQRKAGNNAFAPAR